MLRRMGRLDLTACSSLRNKAQTAKLTPSAAAGDLFDKRRRLIEAWQSAVSRRRANGEPASRRGRIMVDSSRQQRVPGALVSAEALDRILTTTQVQPSYRQASAELIRETVARALYLAGRRQRTPRPKALLKTVAKLSDELREAVGRLYAQLDAADAYTIFCDFGFDLNWETKGSLHDVLVVLRPCLPTVVPERTPPYPTLRRFMRQAAERASSWRGVAFAG
jgi:hypothetical protein